MIEVSMQEEWDKLYEKYQADVLSLVFDDKNGTKYEHNIRLFPKYSQLKYINGVAIYSNVEEKKNIINEDGNTLCDEWYDWIYDFREGIARVKKDGKYSFINEKGKLIKEEWFTYADDFQEGLASVDVDIPGKATKHFFIDKEGNHIFEDKCLYNIEEGFHNGFAIINMASNKKYGYISRDGKVIDNDGKGFDEAERFENGYAPVWVGSNKWYVIDTNGNKVFSYKDYDNWKIFKRNIAFKKKGEEYYTVLDSNGKSISKQPIINYEEAGALAYVTVKTIKNYEINYFLNEKGRITGKGWQGELERIRDTDFYEISHFLGGQIVDKNGKIITDGDDEYYYSYTVGKTGAVIAHKSNCRYNLIKADGTPVTDIFFDEVYPDSSHDRFISIRNNSQFNFIDVYSGKLLFEKWLPHIPYVDKVNKHFIQYNSNFLCIDNYMNDYKVEKKLSGYRCTSKDDTFTVKYTPIKVYGSLVLCYDKKKVYMYDKKKNKYEELGPIKYINYDDNFIIDQENRIVKLIYCDKLIDITDYYIKNIFGKNSITVNRDVVILSKDEFFQGNEETIRNRYKEAEREKVRVLTERKHAEEQKKLEELQVNNDKEQKKKELHRLEAIRYIVTGVAALKRYNEENDTHERLPIEDIFVVVDGVKEINPIYIETGLLKFIDLSVISFKNVKISGVDFRGTNVYFNPQEVYNKDLSNCNFEGISIMGAANFSGINVCGSKFSSDNKSSTFDINSGSFINAIYDENTTLNGIPLKELIEEKNQGTKSA